MRGDKIATRDDINNAMSSSTDGTWSSTYSERSPRMKSVHHINGIKADNRIENLRLIHHGEHTKHHHHHAGKEYRRGYKLNLSDEERAKRADRMRAVRRSGRG